MEKRKQFTPYGKASSQNEWYVQERNYGGPKTSI